LILPVHPGRSVSSDLDQLFHFGVSGILPGNRDLWALLGQPTSSPAYKIGGEDRKLLLEKESRGRADLQVVHGEHIFAFLDARLDGLASIVTVKPAGEIGGNRIMAEVQQRAVPDGLAGMETLQGHVNGIREIREAFVSPGQHLSIVAHLHPTSQRAHSPFQAGSEPIAVGFGIDLIVNFDQEGDVLSGTETSIQAKVSLNGVGIDAVFSLEGLQAVARRWICACRANICRWRCCRCFSSTRICCARRSCRRSSILRRCRALDRAL